MNKLSIFKQVLVLLILFFVEKTQAQQKADKIYITDGSVLSAKVVSTQGDSIFYRAYFARSQKVLFSLPKTKVDKIVYPNDALEFYGGKAVKYLPREERRKTDVIYRKDGSELSVIVVSTTKDSIQYRSYFKSVNKIIFSMPKSDVYIIGYKNGIIEDVSEESAENTRIVGEQIHILQEQKARVRDSIQTLLNRYTNIIKFTPFTLIKNYLVFGYERSVGKGQSAEFKVGIIGLNPEKYELPASGAFGSISFKLKLNAADLPQKPRSPLHGLYFRPEFAFGYYKQTYTHETYRGSNSKPEIQEGKHRVSYQCFVANIGKQWISDSFVFDLFMGGGIGSYNQSASSFGVVNVTRFGYRMDMDAVKGSANVKFKIGLYLGFNFKKQ